MIQRTPDFIRLLAPDLRWQIVQTLKRGDHRVNELVAALDQPKNVVSYHLKQLREEAIITYRRSDADRRDYYYSLNVPRLTALYQQAGQELNIAVADESRDYQWIPPVRVLVLCTRNSARSQIAEGLLRHLGGENVQVFSAGSEPSGVHPLAVKVMDERGIDIRHQVSNHLDDFAHLVFDYVITVCDHVREVCPTFPNVQEQHWSFPDPVIADEDEQLNAFRQTTDGLTERIRYFMTIIDSEPKG
jgi:ArsR family transcriptional regulator, arsenate/arsenite/antimonite-responsive transcriptional repressor / arsenate reductase (thioredoxin)